MSVDCLPRMSDDSLPRMSVDEIPVFKTDITPGHMEDQVCFLEPWFVDFLCVLNK